MHWWLYCQLKTPVPIEQEADWEQDLVWTSWRRGKSFTPTGIHIPDRPVCIIVYTDSKIQAPSLSLKTNFTLLYKFSNYKVQIK
jgi:hypothetical protein